MNLEATVKNGLAKGKVARRMLQGDELLLKIMDDRRKKTSFLVNYVILLKFSIMKFNRKYEMNGNNLRKFAFIFDSRCENVN